MKSCAVDGKMGTYRCIFQPEPEGGYTVTCPALPGLVTYGENFDEAKFMACDAIKGLIGIMIDMGKGIPESGSTL